MSSTATYSTVVLLSGTPSKGFAYKNGNSNLGSFSLSDSSSSTKLSSTNSAITGSIAGGTSTSFTFEGDLDIVKNGTTYSGFVVYNGTNYYWVSNSSAPNGQPTLNFTSSGNSATWVLCFLAGTHIRTPDEEVAVETLKAGDLVTLADGSAAPVTWLGRQTVSTRFADPLRVQPIRVKAGALADGVPSRDLLVSPDHALLVDGILAHASALVNGVSIVREAEIPETFTYYHVELAKHSLILAENTPAESFVDNVERMNFDNWDEHTSDVQIVEMDLPRAKSTRQVPSATKARLLARSAAEQVIAA
jgi:hypothetical protein